MGGAAWVEWTRVGVSGGVCDGFCAERGGGGEGGGGEGGEGGGGVCGGGEGGGEVGFFGGIGFVSIAIVW